MSISVSASMVHFLPHLPKQNQNHWIDKMKKVRKVISITMKLSSLNSMLTRAVSITSKLKWVTMIAMLMLIIIVIKALIAGISINITASMVQGFQFLDLPKLLQKQWIDKITMMIIMVMKTIQLKSFVNIMLITLKNIMERTGKRVTTLVLTTMENTMIMVILPSLILRYLLRPLLKRKRKNKVWLKLSWKNKRREQLRMANNWLKQSKLIMMEIVLQRMAIAWLNKLIMMEIVPQRMEIAWLKQSQRKPRS